jgi:hypothetical protein
VGLVVRQEAGKLDVQHHIAAPNKNNSNATWEQHKGYAWGRESFFFPF